MLRLHVFFVFAAVIQAIGTERYAYALMHYEGTSRDAEYLLGLRVAMQSLRATGTGYDIVVLLSSTVSAESRETLKADGAILKDIEDVPNPYGHVKARFSHALNKIRLWQLVEYTRVIYLDSDTIALDPMDELARCGHFCVVFMNPCNFHTGLLVVKPDMKVHDDMIRKVGEIGSYDGADQGFLVAYFPNAIEAPMFDPAVAKASEAPVMRLQPGYNLNAMWYMEKSNWDLFRCHSRFRELEVPGVSLGYPMAPILKPWYWYAHIYLWDVWSIWDGVRSDLTDAPSYTPVFLLGVAANLFVVGAALYVARSLQLTHSDTVLFVHNAIRARLLRFKRGPLDAPPSLLQQNASNVVGLLVGAFSVASTTLIPLIAIPMMMQPRMAWFLWGMTHTCLNFAQIMIVYTFCLNSSPMASSRRTYERLLLGLRHAAPTLASELAVVLVLRFSLYPSAPYSLGKAAVMLYTFQAGLIWQLNNYRSVVVNELEMSLAMKKTRSQVGMPM